jgi:hypothetical protein
VGAVAVAEILDRDTAGAVHLRPIPGSVADNLHLMRKATSPQVAAYAALRVASGRAYDRVR